MKGNKMNNSNNERFAVKQDQDNPRNWGIIWETNGTEGGFTSADYARKSAIEQGGIEVNDEESATWNW